MTRAEQASKPHEAVYSLIPYEHPPAWSGIVRPVASQRPPTEWVVFLPDVVPGLTEETAKAIFEVREVDFGKAWLERSHRASLSLTWTTPGMHRKEDK